MAKLTARVLQSAKELLVDLRRIDRSPYPNVSSLPLPLSASAGKKCIFLRVGWGIASVLALAATLTALNFSGFRDRIVDPIAISTHSLHRSPCSGYRVWRSKGRLYRRRSDRRADYGSRSDRGASSDIEKFRHGIQGRRRQAQTESECQRHVRKTPGIAPAVHPAAFHGNSLTCMGNGDETQPGCSHSVLVKSPEELNAKLSNPRRTGIANNPKPRVADVPSGIRELRVIEDIEKFDAEIES